MAVNINQMFDNLITSIKYFINKQINMYVHEKRLRKSKMKYPPLLILVNNIN